MYLFVVQESTRHYIMADHQGTPIAVFDSDGKLVKQMFYTVYGEVLTDTAPTLNIFIGYKVTTGVHFTVCYLASVKT